MTSRKPLASVSLDLDNKWAYLKTHGDAGWDSFPTYLPLVVPRVLCLLKERGLKITFFIVGQDAALHENRAALAAIAAAGHEIGNHSFRHEPWLHLYSEAEIEADLAVAEEAIQKATGRKPVGFRGPGFSLSTATLQVLARRGYLYDASTFPTFLGPLARAYYFMTAQLTPEEKRRRALLFGSFHEGFRPLRPYRWQTAAGPLVELPVTTMPFLRLPIHVSYLLYLASCSSALARLYFRAALLACRLASVRPSLLLHPLDFLGAEDEPDLSFFPAMGMPGARKIRLVGEVLDMLAGDHTVVPLREHALASGALLGAPSRALAPMSSTGLPACARLALPNTTAI